MSTDAGVIDHSSPTPETPVTEAGSQDSIVGAEDSPAKHDIEETTEEAPGAATPEETPTHETTADQTPFTESVPPPAPTALSKKPQAKKPRGRQHKSPKPAAAPTLPEPTEEDLQRHESFGRVDEEGTVWVRTPEGETSVGSYPSATPEEALRFFAKKYDEQFAHIQLLKSRISSTDISVQDATTALDRLRESTKEAHGVGDLAALQVGLTDVSELIEQRRAEIQAAKEAARAKTRGAKEKIVFEAEELAQSTAWKPSGDRIRALVDEWKALPRIDRKSDDELWKRFSSARSTFDKRRRVHFATLDSNRQSAKAEKERLVKQAESLATSREWGPTSAVFRDIMTQWKELGRAGRADEEELWGRLRAAQDTFFTARNAVFTERDAEEKANLKKKQALLVEAERLVPITDLAAAKTSLRSIQDRWESIGHLPRNQKDKIEARLRLVEKAVREADQEQWRRSNPETKARAHSTTSQLRTAIEKLEAKAATARAAGKEKEAQALEAEVIAKREWLAQAEKYM